MGSAFTSKLTSWTTSSIPLNTSHRNRPLSLAVVSMIVSEASFSSAPCRKARPLNTPKLFVWIPRDTRTSSSSRVSSSGTRLHLTRMPMLANGVNSSSPLSRHGRVTLAPALAKTGRKRKESYPLKLVTFRRMNSLFSCHGIPAGGEFGDLENKWRILGGLNLLIQFEFL